MRLFFYIHLYVFVSQFQFPVKRSSSHLVPRVCPVSNLAGAVSNLVRPSWTNFAGGVVSISNHLKKNMRGQYVYTYFKK